MTLAIALVLWAALIAAWVQLRRRRRKGAPAVEVLDDTEPLDDPKDSVPPCIHGVPVSSHCQRCDGVMRGKHVTLDDPEPPEAA